MSVVTTTLGVFSLIAGISILVEDELYGYQDKKSATILSILLIYLILKSYLLQTQDLRVGQANEPYIGLSQENSIENLV